MRRGDAAWLALGAGVVVYEAASPYEELLSCAMDRYLMRHPWVVRAAVTITALHLCNWLPSAVDPYHGFGLLILRKKS